MLEFINSDIIGKILPAALIGMGLFLCACGKDDTALGLLFCFNELDNNSVCKGFDCHFSSSLGGKRLSPK